MCDGHPDGDSEVYTTRTLDHRGRSAAVESWVYAVEGDIVTKRRANRVRYSLCYSMMEKDVRIQRSRSLMGGFDLLFRSSVIGIALV